MAASVAAARGNAVGQSLSPSLPGLIGEVPSARRREVPPVDPVHHLWLLKLAAESIDSTIGRKEAAARLNVSDSVLSRLLSAQDGKCLNLARLGELGEAVTIDLAARIRRHFGLDDPAERIQHAMNLVAQGLAAIVAEVKR